MPKFTSHSLSNQAHRPTVRTAAHESRRTWLINQLWPTPDNQRLMFAALRRDYDAREGLTEPVPGPTSDAQLTPRAPRSARRRIHRHQKGEASPDDAGDPDPPAAEPPPPLQPAPYPAPSAWNQDPALDFAWCAPGYDLHAEQLDSLHRPTPPESVNPLSPVYRYGEQRPDPESLIPWDMAKASSLALAERLQRTAAGMSYAHKMRTCQHSLTFRPLVDGGWAVSKVRRCSLRLCPNNKLARVRQLRPRVDALAAGIVKHGPLLFLTLAAQNATIPELWKAWTKTCKGRPFKRAVLGYFVGLHVSIGLRPHLHAVLVCAESNLPTRRPVPYRIAKTMRTPQAGPEELPEIARSALGIPPLVQWWYHACRAVGLSVSEDPPSAEVEAVRSPAQCLQYIACPASPALVDDFDLPALFALLKDIKVIRTAGICAEYWTPADEDAGPDWLGGPAEARRYGWQSDLDAYEITPSD